MPCKRETTFYNSVHKHLPVELYRMKTHNPFVGGVPDLWYSGPGGDLWAEYKFIVLPKRDSTLVKIDLSGLQKDWIIGRHKEGRNTAVIVGCKEGGVIFHGLTWEIPITAKNFREKLLTRKQLAQLLYHEVFIT